MKFTFSRQVLFLLLWQTAAIAVPIKVDVDRQKVSLNESFQIVFSTSEDPDGNPDFKPLEKDFKIINKNQSSTSSWGSSGEGTTIQWTFKVMAKRTGKVTIPALHFGSETSPAKTIEVTEGKSVQPDVTSNDAELFLEVETPTPAKERYVQSQVLYSVHFFTRVNISAYELKAPVITDAVVTNLGEDKNYEIQLKGISYIVVERNYAIFPQKSGQITIPALTLTAAVLESGDQSGFGGFFGAQATRRERVSSQPVVLNVLPAPATFKEHWLAAQKMEIKQEWSGDVLNMKVGEPLTRTLTLTAQGTPIGQLPTLHPATSNEDLKSYPDQPRLEEQKSPQGVVAVREEKIAFIPAKAGTYTLPALQITWFNVKTGQIETAKLPSVTVIVTGSAQTANANAATPVDKTVENSVDKQAVINNVPLANNNSAAANNYLWQGLAAFFAIGWLATIIFMVKTRKKESSLDVSKTIDNSTASINSDLKKACFDNDANAAKQLLIAWGTGKYNANTLGTIAQFCDARLSNEILILNQSLYGKSAQNWDGKKLFQAFSEHKAMEKAKPKQQDKLEPLHRL